MPRGDGTGPEGNGPLTGQGLGNCGNSTNTVNRTRRVGLNRWFGPRSTRGNQQPQRLGLARRIRRRFGRGFRRGFRGGVKSED